MANCANSDIQYFAALPAKEAIEVMYNRANSWFDTLVGNRYLNKVRKSWNAYHGIFFAGTDGHSIEFGGEQGEYVDVAVNHYRNIASHMLNMITANRPMFQAQAANTDYKTLAQTELANSLLEYYMREKKLETHLKRAAEYAIALGSGYLKMEWNSQLGKVYDYTDSGYPIMEGDVVFTNHSVTDVVFDSTKETSDADWVIVRSWQNKFNLAAKYPEHKDAILKLQTKSQMYKSRIAGYQYDETTDIPVYEFFHKESEAMPEGRYLLYLSADLALLDSPMPYSELPVYRISPSDILGTPYGYTPMFDLLPLQDLLNSLYSIVATNQNAFGVQSIAVADTSNITVSSLMSGLNIVKYQPNASIPNGGLPHVLQLTATPKEIFDQMDRIKGDMETISGINAVVRGDAPANLESGAALALVQSQALQFMSGLQQSYVQLVESVGTGLIKMLQVFAQAPRLVAIVGENNKTEMKEFSGQEVSEISRVFVTVGNSFASTPAGRMTIAEQLMKMKPEEFTVDQYISIINTGQLSNMTENSNSEMMLAKEENRALIRGEKPPIALVTDSHWMHIKEHKAVIADPELRYDSELTQRTLDHINEHLEYLRTGDPDLLLGLGQQPLSMQNPAATGPGAVDGRPPGAEAGPSGGPPMEVPMEPPSGVADSGQVAPNLPQPAQPPTSQGPMTAAEALPLSPKPPGAPAAP